MTDQTSGYDRLITHAITLPIPRKRKGLLLPYEEWDDLKERIGHVNEKMSWFVAAGWTLLGLAVPSGVQAIVAYQQVTQEKGRIAVVIWTAAALVSGVCSIFAFVTAGHEKDMRREQAKAIIATMKMIELRYEVPDGGTADRHGAVSYLGLIAAAHRELIEARKARKTLEL